LATAARLARARAGPSTAVGATAARAVARLAGGVAHGTTATVGTAADEPAASAPPSGTTGQCG
jgi:hypothetical protein